MKTEFKLIGLSRPASATLQHLDSDRDIFWATINMPQDRIDALWNLCEGDWKNMKIAEIECDGLSEDGTPINAKMIGFRFN